MSKLLLDRNPQPLSLLLKETARSRCADFVHLKVHHHAIVKANVFGVLTTDFKNRIHLRINIGGGCRLGSDLIPHDIGPHKIGCQISSRARGRHPLDVHSVPDFPVDFGEPYPDSLDGATSGHEVSLGQEIPLPIDDNKIGTDGSNVQPQIGFNPFRLGEIPSNRIGTISVMHRKGERPMRSPFLLVVSEVVYESLQTLEGLLLSPVQLHPDCAQGPHGGKVFRNDEVLFLQLKDIQKRTAHTHIGGNPSLETDGLCERPALPDVAFEISGQGVAEPCHNVVVRGGDLLEMDHVRLGKHAAPTGNTGRVL